MRTPYRKGRPFPAAPDCNRDRDYLVLVAFCFSDWRTMAWPSVLLPEVAVQAPPEPAAERTATVVPQTLAANATGTWTMTGTAMLLSAAIWFC